MTTRDEARSEVEAALERDERLQLSGCVVAPPDTLRALLAGPPEPSEEEIARTLYPEAFLWSGDPTVALKAAAMVQALYRIRRA